MTANILLFGSLLGGNKVNKCICLTMNNYRKLHGQYKELSMTHGKTLQDVLNEFVLVVIQKLSKKMSYAQNILQQSPPHLQGRK